MADATVFYSGPIVTREEAKTNGDKRYFTGNACKHGHVAQRSTSNYQCIVCTYEYTAMYSAQNRGKRRMWDKSWRNKNPEKCKARSTRWRKLNRARRNARERALEKRNPELTRARKQRWVERNRDKVNAHGRANVAKRRAIKKQVGGSYTMQDVTWLLKRQRAKCVACKKDIRHAYHVDHIVPLSKGGSNGRRNLQLLCPPCNLSKHAKDPIDFMQERGFLL